MKILRLLAALVLLAGCGPTDELARAAERMTAIESGRPFTVPAQVLTAHTGAPYDLRAGTSGRFTLLFFGYTYCPDICPIQMAMANAAVELLSDEERERVVTLFVTMDPQRDSVERLAAWLTGMRSSAVGLRTTTSELDALLGAMGFVMPPMTARQPVPGGTGDGYLVPHPTSLFLITPDGMGRFQYPHDRGTPADIATDLRTLMALEWASATRVDGEATGVTVDDVRIGESVNGRSAGVYARIDNAGAGRRSRRPRLAGGGARLAAPDEHGGRNDVDGADDVVSGGRGEFLRAPSGRSARHARGPSGPTRRRRLRRGDLPLRVGRGGDGPCPGPGPPRPARPLTGGGAEVGDGHPVPALDPDVEDARTPDGRLLRAVSFIERPLDEVFDFFARAENLQEITPPALDFSIVTPLPIEMREGTRIDYRLRLSGIPFGWQTEITEWDPPYAFTDEQLRGPYRTWIHRHTFEPLGSRVRMVDEVRWRLPLEPVGSVALPFVRRRLRSIFTYRAHRLDQIFR